MAAISEEASKKLSSSSSEGEKFEDTQQSALKNKSKSLTNIHDHSACKTDFDQNHMRLVNVASDDVVELK